MTQFQDPAFKIAAFTVERWRNASLLVKPSILGNELMRLERASFQGFPDSKQRLVWHHNSVEFDGTISDRAKEVNKASDVNGCTTLFKRLVVSVFPVDDIAVDVSDSFSSDAQVGFIVIVAMVNRFLIVVRSCDRLKFPVVPKVAQLLVLLRAQRALGRVIDCFTGNLTRQVQPSASCWRAVFC